MTNTDNAMRWIAHTINTLVEPAARVRSFKAFTDGSGAPAVITVMGYTFAFDWLNGLTCNLIGHPATTSRHANEGAARRASTAYRALVANLLTPEWHALNQAMYE